MEKKLERDSQEQSWIVQIHKGQIVAKKGCGQNCWNEKNIPELSWHWIFLKYCVASKSSHSFQDQK